jgi:hypothetical protein
MKLGIILVEEDEKLKSAAHLRRDETAKFCLLEKG